MKPAGSNNYLYMTSRHGLKSSNANAPNIEIELLKMVLEIHNDLILRPIQDQEIKEAIFQMDKY